MSVDLDAIPLEQVPAAIAKLSARLLQQRPERSSARADDALTPAEAAKLLHVSRKYVYAHVRDLGGVRLGKGPRARVRFSRRKLLARLG
jgi:excisionase family DNA binding protein